MPALKSACQPGGGGLQAWRGMRRSTDLRPWRGCRNRRRCPVPAELLQPVNFTGATAVATPARRSAPRSASGASPSSYTVKRGSGSSPQKQHRLSARDAISSEAVVSPFRQWYWGSDSRPAGVRPPRLQNSSGSAARGAGAIRRQVLARGQGEANCRCRGGMNTRCADGGEHQVLSWPMPPWCQTGRWLQTFIEVVPLAPCP